MSDTTNIIWINFTENISNLAFFRYEVDKQWNDLFWSLPIGDGEAREVLEPAYCGGYWGKERIKRHLLHAFDDINSLASHAD